MRRIAVRLGGSVLLVAGFGCALTLVGHAHPNPAAAGSWTGAVSDSNCGAEHAQPSTAATRCVGRCVSSGAKYVLVSGGRVYNADTQEKFVDYVGKLVKVTGTLKGSTIAVSSVEPVQ